tara:strand:- start:591 stop:920 length:330 start_codon:yes stop_codon:yes gene_type:complete
MFDLGSWGEFLIIAMAALILIGPKEMPGLLKTLGRWIYRAKKTFRQFRQTYDTYLQEGELEEYIKDTNKKVLEEEKEIPQTAKSSSQRKDDDRKKRTSKAPFDKGKDVK